VTAPYNGVTVRKSLFYREEVAFKSGLKDVAAKSDQEIVKIRIRRRT
jgi:hypothetical protein